MDKKIDVIGYVNYSVRVQCPHCNGRLDLNQEPYSNESPDELGMALFGSTYEPAQWENLKIEYVCNHCKKAFRLITLEY